MWKSERIVRVYSEVFFQVRAIVFVRSIMDHQLLVMCRKSSHRVLALYRFAVTSKS